MRQTYNYRQLEKLMRASNSLVFHVTRRVRANSRTYVTRYGGDPLGAAADFIERAGKLKNPGRREAERKRFGREHDDLIERLWRNYQAIQAMMRDGTVEETPDPNRGGFNLARSDSDGLTPAQWDDLLCHHLTESHNDPQKNGTYYRESEAKPYGMTIYENLNRRVEVKRKPETPEEYRRFSKIDGVVGGRRVMPLGRKPRDTSVDAMGRRLAPDSEEASGLDSIGTASAEYERERDRELLGNARTYKRFTPEQYRERVDALAAHGEAIIAEEERKLGLR